VEGTRRITFARGCSYAPLGGKPEAHGRKSDDARLSARPRSAPAQQPPTAKHSSRKV
jgi:hypothetical protein